jgi:hypothetical protein
MNAAEPRAMSAPTPSAVRALLDSGLTVRDIADPLRAHPLAIAALAATEAATLLRRTTENRKGALR